jgi:hypothetical protein
MTANSTQFFLGRLFDLKAGKLTSDPLNYDPPDLTTHAIVTGMTGSGKTGLCIDLLEEAALQGIPAIIVDPKGDLTNLMLHFPQQRPTDFEPWIDPDNARRSGKTLSQLSAETADTWKKGLADWGLGQPDLQALSDSVERTIYTPGSTGGVPVNILASFAAPQMDWDINQELLRDKIASIITALLTLIGMRDIDPLRSREHILLSNIIENAWKQKQSLSLQDIIMQTQEPPFTRLGAFEVDTFFPKKDRSQLALLLNNFLASPSFQTWISGQPLNAEELLYDKNGKARHSIFYIAHLDETERMFFVTLLFAAVESWMRLQRGSGNLRALIYFDEILGYLPPVANPASKPIMIRMVKQARAFGVGLVFATQNPVDVDYKALSNAGTWMIGRLQTDQDKQRLLDGLESAAGGVARSDYDRMISALPKRVFLYQNVHSKAPLIFQSRWALDYLAGPLTLNQIPSLNQLAGVTPFSGRSQKSTAAEGTASVGSRANTATNTLAFSGKPDLPAEIQEYFLPAQNTGGQLIYQPTLLAQAEVNYYSRTPNVNFTRTYSVRISNPGTGSLDWESGKTDPVDPKSLQQGPVSNSKFDPLPGHLKDAKWWNARSTQFEEWIYETQAAIVYVHKKLGIVSEDQESLDLFKERCRQLMVQSAPSGNTTFDNKRADLQRKIDAQQAKVNQYQNDVTHYTLEEGGHVLGTVINIFTRGRTTGASSTISANRRRSAAQAKLDGAKSTLVSLQQQLAALQGDPQPGQNLSQNDIQEIKISPSKRDIVIKAFGLAWIIN